MAFVWSSYDFFRDLGRDPLGNQLHSVLYCIPHTKRCITCVARCRVEVGPDSKVKGERPHTRCQELNSTDTYMDKNGCTPRQIISLNTIRPFEYYDPISQMADQVDNPTDFPWSHENDGRRKRHLHQILNKTLTSGWEQLFIEGLDC